MTPHCVHRYDLTPGDPEPPPGSVVETTWGERRERIGDDEVSWVMADRSNDGDLESWTKVAGNYGPVALIERG